MRWDGPDEVDVDLPSMLVHLGRQEGEVGVLLPLSEEAAASAVWAALRVLAEHGWTLYDASEDQELDLEAGWQIIRKRFSEEPPPFLQRFVVWPLCVGAFSAALSVVGFLAMLGTFWLLEALARWGLPREPAPPGNSVPWEGLALWAASWFAAGTLVTIILAIFLPGFVPWSRRRAVPFVQRVGP